MKEVKEVVLNADEIGTIIDLIHDWGFEYALVADRDQVRELALKLGIDPKWVEMHI